MATASVPTGAVERSQREWRRCDGSSTTTAVLGNLAAELYPDATRVGTTGVLTRPGWMPAEPVELDSVELRWVAVSDGACAPRCTSS